MSTPASVRGSETQYVVSTDTEPPLWRLDPPISGSAVLCVADPAAQPVLCGLPRLIQVIERVLQMLRNSPSRDLGSVDRPISPDGSEVSALVILSREDLQIAREVRRLLGQ